MKNKIFFSSKSCCAIFLIALCAIQILPSSAGDHDDAVELTFEEVLARMKAFSKLLAEKFMPKSEKKVASLAHPETLVKMRPYSKADYMLLRVMALEADYAFDDGPVPFKWMCEKKWPPEEEYGEHSTKHHNVDKIESSKTKTHNPDEISEDSSKHHTPEEIKANNMDSVKAFVLNVCAIIRNGAIEYKTGGVVLRFHEYMPVFENLVKLHEIIKNEAVVVAKLTEKEMWKTFDPKTYTVNRLEEQSNWGLLDMKASGEVLNKDHLLQYTEVLKRKTEITTFLIDLTENNGERKSIFERPEEFLQLARDKFQHEKGVINIFEALAKQCGYEKWHKKCEKKEEKGGTSSEGEEEKLGKKKKLGNEEKHGTSSEEEEQKQGNEERHATSEGTEKKPGHGTSEGKEEEKEEEKHGKKDEGDEEKPDHNECEKRLKSKLLKLYASIYQTIRQQPLNAKKQSLENYELVYAQVHKVEEHYKQKHSSPQEWDALMKATYDKLKKQYTFKDSDEISYWGWIYACTNYLKSILGKQIDCGEAEDGDQPKADHHDQSIIGHIGRIVKHHIEKIKGMFRTKPAHGVEAGQASHGHTEAGQSPRGHGLTLGQSTRTGHEEKADKSSHGEDKAGQSPRGKGKAGQTSRGHESEETSEITN